MGTYLRLRAGQGATEYLVLLAVVLIVALVSVALLGFFPGMASDSQITQSQTYWQSSSPITITEWGARWALNGVPPGYTHIYLKIKNMGAYPLRLAKVLGNGRSTASLCTGGWNCGGATFSNIYLYPGEEKILGYPAYFSGLPDLGDGNRAFFVPDYQMSGFMSANCSQTAPFGTAAINSFGFEYTEYIEGQQITKREVGAKPVTIKCMNNYD